MAKFVKKRDGLRKTINYMGEPAYNLVDNEKLLNLVATCMVHEPKYYGDIGKIEEEIFELCKNIRSEYILQLAVYTRQELNLRSVAVYLLAIAAYIPETKRYIRKYTPAIIQRADEIKEVLACYIELFGKPIPNSLKKGVADAFGKFDEYQLAKYNTSGSVTLKDVILMTHPAAYNKDNIETVKNILDDKLEIPMTWETQISSRGNKPEVWDDLIRTKKLPYMATLRNLRNMAQAGITEMDAVIKYITNENAIKNSRQLPHRFLSAYEAIANYDDDRIKFEKETSGVTNDDVKEALEVAIKISAEKNIPRIPGKTIILCDNSGSARGDYGGPSRVSSRSVRTMADIGNLLGLLTWYSAENTMFAVFGDRLITVQPDREKGILENFKAIDKAGDRAGPSTEQGVFTMLEQMIAQKTFADRMIVCSDLQIGDGKNQEYGTESRYGKSVTVPGLVDTYRKKVNPNFIYYSVCFNGYGTDVIIGDKKVLISGFSDNILKFIQSHESDSKAQINHIKTINPGSYDKPKRTQEIQGTYHCAKCGRNHKANSKIGQDHAGHRTV